jgi:hypothetical protein
MMMMMMMMMMMIDERRQTAIDRSISRGREGYGESDWQQREGRRRRTALLTLCHVISTDVAFSAAVFLAN